MHFRSLIIFLSAAMVWSGSALAQDESLETLAEKSQAAMKAEQWQQALDLNTQAVSRYGQNEPFRKYGAQFGAVFYHKGICEMKLKRWQEAMRSFESCYRDFPNEGADRGNLFQKLALLKWGEAAMGAEQWELAVSRFTKFRDERKIGDDFAWGAFHINLAVCHYKLGHFPEGNENLEIAIQNKADFPTPEIGIVAGFQGLVEAAITARNEQVLLDFIGKNRGGLVIDPVAMERFSGAFLKLAGDALAAGMQRTAIALYQFVPATEAGETIKLAAIALIHEKHGNIRGAFAAYQQLERYFPAAANREESLYQLVRTAALLGEADLAGLYAGRLRGDFPKSPRLEEIRTAGIKFPENEIARPPLKVGEPIAAAKPFPASREFAVAIDFYQGRKYREAKAMFGEIQHRLKATKSPDRDASTLAAFYEMECLRKLGDLDGLAAALRAFPKEPSFGGHRLRQLEINTLWDAVRTKSWERVESLANARLQERLPGDQRAQVAYCFGLALENLGRPLEALNAFHLAMTADAGASEEIARHSALHVLGIHHADPEVRAIISPLGIGENQNSPGVSRLKEAAAMAELFEFTLGAGMPLPAEFMEFLKGSSKS
ncbi:MAG TPA: tetratricopeptide repeat protein [Luteolibacter sp.]